MSSTALLEGAVSGESRLDIGQALELYDSADLLDLGIAADAVRFRILGTKPATYLIDRNINYTNICENQCRFCAFYRDAGVEEAYLLSTDEIEEKVREAVELGATQIMLQGGLHPDLDIRWFTSLFRRLKSRYPIHLHSLSPPEIVFLAGKTGLSVEETLGILHDSGLDSLPGGGAEILVDRVRRLISPKKICSADWLGVMEAAHRLGLPTTGTMMMGTGETVAERFEHLGRLRDLQDRTDGFLSFIPWTFQPANTSLGSGGASTLEYLRMLALSRLFLDNFINIQGSWVTQGAEIGQLTLSFGANDLGSIMLEENVVRAAGTSYRLDRSGMIDLISATGRRCAQRDTLFHLLSPGGDVSTEDPTHVTPHSCERAPLEQSDVID